MSLEIPASIKPWLNFIHPLLMWVLFATALYALYLGVLVQRTRNAQGEVKKELIKGKFNVKHYQVGSVLLALMVIGTLIGMGATYINNQKLFFGPHLLAGLGMTGLIAASASLSPYMQKGQNWARYTHIALNVVLLGLFGWQAITGVQIVQKIVSQM
jgi:flagellar biosynthesis protein FliQ